MPDFYRLELQGLDTVRTGLKKAPAIAKQEVKKFMSSTVRHLTAEVVDRTPNVSGILRRSIGGSVDMLGVTPADGLGIVGIVGTSLDYAIPVELGVRPHERTSKKGKKFTHPGFSGRRMFAEAFVDNRAQIESDFEQTVERIMQRIAEGK